LLDNAKVLGGPASKPLPAVSLAMDYAFKILNLHKLSLVVDCENHRALAVYTKLGFKKEGLLRHEYFADGKYRDVFRMALLQDEHISR
jgi:diamine N-acetyltransferase